MQRPPTDRPSGRGRLGRSAIGTEPERSDQVERDHLEHHLSDLTGPPATVLQHQQPLPEEEPSPARYAWMGARTGQRVRSALAARAVLRDVAASVMGG